MLCSLKVNFVEKIIADNNITVKTKPHIIFTFYIYNGFTNIDSDTCQHF